MTAVDVRNNNPLNIRPGAPWEGLATPSESGGFCVFISPVFGFRAVFKNYITKADRGVNTVRELISEWAPPSDNNDTAAYIDSVCQKTGFKPDQIIDLKKWDVCSALCYAQTIVESGESFEKNWTVKDMAEGAMRAGIVDAPRSPIRKIAVVATGIGSAVSAAAPSAIDAINTYRPVVDQSNNTTLKAAFGFIAVVLALLAVISHVNASRK